jgi:hypothetical protein
MSKCRWEIGKVKSGVKSGSCIHVKQSLFSRHRVGRDFENSKARFVRHVAAIYNWQLGSFSASVFELLRYLFIFLLSRRGG